MTNNTHTGTEMRWHGWHGKGRGRGGDSHELEGDAELATDDPAERQLVFIVGENRDLAVFHFTSNGDMGSGGEAEALGFAPGDDRPARGL